MSSVSSIVPPTFLTRRMSRRSTLVEAGVTRRRTESTAMGERMEEYWETICAQGNHQLLLPLLLAMNGPTLELRLVLAALRRLSRSFRSTGVEISSRYSTTFFAARPNDSAIMVGWMPLPRSFSAAPRRDPARTTTDVVPSPASISCAAERSTSCCVAPKSAFLRQVRRAGRETHHASSGVHHAHVLEDSRSVVRDDNLAVGGRDHLVHTARTQGRANSIRDRCTTR